jgi:AP-3 complex subunit delta-1
MNINGLFAHSLTDLIRGIRQNKKNEQGYIAKEIADIRLELRRNDPDLKAQAIAKLTYVSQHKYLYMHLSVAFRNYYCLGQRTANG